MAGGKKPRLHPSGNGKASVLAFNPQTVPGVVHDGISQQLLLTLEPSYQSCSQFPLNLKYQSKSSQRG